MGQTVHLCRMAYALILSLKKTFMQILRLINTIFKRKATPTFYFVQPADMKFSLLSAYRPKRCV